LTWSVEIFMVEYSGGGKQEVQLPETIPCLACAFIVLSASSCSSSSSTDTAQPTSTADAGDAGTKASLDADVIDAYAGTATEHGVVVDYSTLKPVAGLTVTDHGATATTDATGTFTLTAPSGSRLSPSVTGPSYSTLLFPVSIPAAADVDFGTLVMPTSSIYMVEQAGLSNDTSEALVQLVVVTAPSCASAVGGTIQVLSPSGAKFNYFSADSLPDGTVTSFQAVTPPRPVAVIFDIKAGAALSVQITHPKCKQAEFPFTYQGKTYTGQVPTVATEPGDTNAAMVMMLE
jgi:hypothetical protein